MPFIVSLFYLITILNSNIKKSTNLCGIFFIIALLQFNNKQSYMVQPKYIPNMTAFLYITIFRLVYSALLSDSIMSILSNALYITMFTTTENAIVKRTE